jgi:O-antigen/teichoic acid export membrane protein
VYALSYLFSGLNVLGYLDFYYIKNSRKIMLYNVAGIISIFGCTLVGIYYFDLWGVVVGLLMARIINFLLLYSTYYKFRQRINHHNILLLLGLSISLIIGADYIANSELLNYPVVGWLQFSLISLMIVYTNRKMFKQLVLPKLRALWSYKFT